MKQARIPLIVVAVLGIAFLIVGSFVDLNLSQSLGANPGHVLGLIISVIAPTLGFAGLCLIGGGFLALGLRKEDRTWHRVLFIIAAVAIYGVSIHYAGKEYFGVNGFYGSAHKVVGYLIAALPLAGAEALGYFLVRNTKNPKAWILLLIACGVAFIALVPGTTALKEIFHRPRYRVVMAYEDIAFHNWWEPCKNYKDLMAAHGLESEEFKSFPSGHSTEISLLFIAFTFVPMLNEKLKKYQIWLYVGAFALFIATAFGRIASAAHFLSDVSMGMLLAVLGTLIANEVVIHIQALHNEEGIKPIEHKPVSE